MKKLVILIIVILLASCRASGEVSEGYENIVKYCTDFRDGDKFIFNSSTISNVRIGYFGSPSQFDVVTYDGRHITLTSNQEYIKCADKL